MANAAEQAGVDYDALAIPDAIVGALYDDAHHLVPHDARIADRDRAMIDLQIRSTNAAMADSNQNLVVARLWFWNRFEAHVVGRSEDHGFHKGIKTRRASSFPNWPRMCAKV